DAESRVDRAISQITDGGKVIEGSRVLRGPNGDDLAISLDENGKRVVIETVKIGCDLAPVSKGRVRRSIRIVALQSEVSIRRVLTGKINEVSSSGDDLAIGLQGQSEGIASLTRKTRCHNAAIAKGSVERSLRVLTDQLEVAEKSKEWK